MKNQILYNLTRIRGRVSRKNAITVWILSCFLSCIDPFTFLEQQNNSRGTPIEEWIIFWDILLQTEGFDPHKTVVLHPPWRHDVMREIIRSGKSLNVTVALAIPAEHFQKEHRLPAMYWMVDLQAAPLPKLWRQVPVTKVLQRGSLIVYRVGT